MSEQALPIVIDTHKVNPANDRVEVLCLDGQGAGGAHHFYAVLLPSESDKNLAVEVRRELFHHSQSGPVFTQYLAEDGRCCSPEISDELAAECTVVVHLSDGSIKVQPPGDVTEWVGAPGSFVFGFQNGPINKSGVNGATQEVLMAIIEHRLESFQAGPFACRENALALTHLQESKMWLFDRTLKRMRRGVEGTHKHR